MSGRSFLPVTHPVDERPIAVSRPAARDGNPFMFRVATLLIWAQRRCGADTAGSDMRDQKPVDSPSRKVRGRSGVIWAPPAN